MASAIKIFGLLLLLVLCAGLCHGQTASKLFGVTKRATSTWDTVYVSTSGYVTKGFAVAVDTTSTTDTLWVAVNGTQATGRKFPVLPNQPVSFAGMVAKQIYIKTSGGVLPYRLLIY